MSISPGSFSTSSLVDILQTLVNTKQTGYLKMQEGDRQGCVAIENGVIINAKTDNTMGLHALFQFVGWREATFDFHERPMPVDLTRDLAVYDAHVLITGVAFKVDEVALLLQATPPLDSVVRYVGGEVLLTAAVEATPADLGLLSLADGRRTVREIAGMVNLSPLEVARNLARFRLVGVLEVVPSKTPRAPKAPPLAATA